MTDRKILITVAHPDWSEEDQEELMYRLDNALYYALFRDDYTIEEIKK